MAAEKTLKTTRFVRCAVAVVLGFTFSPGLITHNCDLRSRLLEFPIIIISVSVLPFFVLRQEDGRRSWLLVLSTPILALAITLGYFSFLHSSFFPVRLLDQSARNWEKQSQHMRLFADLSAIQTELEENKTANGVYPTTDQGLRALVLTPVSSPVPGHWTQLFHEEPLDPWGAPYVYQCPGTKNPNKYDVFSAGLDHIPYTSDDDWGDDAQNDLRLIYENGESVPTVAEFLQKAADHGDAEAQNNLGQFYQNGRGF